MPDSGRRKKKKAEAIEAVVNEPVASTDVAAEPSAEESATDAVVDAPPAALDCGRRGPCGAKTCISTSSSAYS